MRVDSLVRDPPCQRIFDILHRRLEVMFEFILQCWADRGREWREFIEDVTPDGLGGLSPLWYELQWRNTIRRATLTSSVQLTMSSSMGRSAYARAYSSWTIPVAVVIHESSQLASQKYWSLCHGCKTARPNWIFHCLTWARELTHCYVVDFCLISQSIVFV